MILTVSKYINRLSQYLGLRPAFMDVAAFIMFTLAALAIAATDYYIAYGGILFVLANLLHLAARWHHPQTETTNIQAAPTYHLLIRYLGYALFICACGISGYRHSGDNFYLYATIITIFLWGYIVLLLSRLAGAESAPLRDLIQRARLEQTLTNSRYRAKRLLIRLRGLLYAEHIPLLILLLTLTGQPVVLFWVGTACLVITIAMIIRLLVILRTEEARTLSQSVISFIFYLGGAALLLFLVARLPFSDVIDVFDLVGPEVLVLLLFPAIWVIPYAMTLTVLLDKRITLRDALYTQLTGDAFNSITPLLGMGGEPYKARHLSRFVSLQDSSHAIIQSRLIHALSGVFLTAVVLSLCLGMVDFSSLPGLRPTLLAVIVLMLAAAGLILWVTMSQAPSRLSGFVLARFKLIEEVRHDDLSWKKLLTALLYRIIGRGGKLMELYLIFLVLDMSPSLADVVLVEGMILTSISVFFFVPQGLGVNEAGIATAFTIAGYPAATAVVFGLIRRARMVVYALMGLAVYLVGSYYYRRQPVN